MPVSRSLARSRRHLSQRQQNWFSMRSEELPGNALDDQNTSTATNQDSCPVILDLEHPVDL